MKAWAGASPTSAGPGNVPQICPRGLKDRHSGHHALTGWEVFYVACPESAAESSISSLDRIFRDAETYVSQLRRCFEIAGSSVAPEDRISLILRFVEFAPARLFGGRGTCSSELRQNSGVPECPDFRKFLSGFWTFAKACTAVTPMLTAGRLQPGLSTPFRTVCLCG